VPRAGGRGQKGGNVIVKVCGVSTPDVAEAALEAGADWIGLVFAAGSPRQVGPAAAAAVVAAVGGRADLIGVLVSPTPEQCDALSERYGLAAVQVHGDVDPLLVERCHVPVIRAINVRTKAEAFTFDWWPDSLVLLDAAGEGGRAASPRALPAGGGPPLGDALPGGTGRRLPPEWAATVARHRDIVLAGGLGPDNVADAIAQVRPRGVDASSGLETAPGVKDVARVRAYVRSARAAFAVCAGETA